VNPRYLSAALLRFWAKSFGVSWMGFQNLELLSKEGGKSSQWEVSSSERNKNWRLIKKIGA
jgi:hypothetical protein